MKKINLIFIVGIVVIFLTSCSPKNPFPLSDPGHHQFGTHQYKFLDTNRMNKEIGLYIWYPAMLQKDAEPSRYNFDGPDSLIHIT